MKKGQILEGKIREVVFPNKGIAEVENENKPVIVKNSLAGQKVRFSINKIIISYMNFLNEIFFINIFYFPSNQLS